MNSVHRIPSARLERLAIFIALAVAAAAVTPLILSDIEVLWEVTALHRSGSSSVALETFDFRDYRGIDDAGRRLTAALKTLFPVGTPKAVIENVLVKRNGARFKPGLITRDGQTETVVTYVKDASILYAPLCDGKVWIITVTYARDATLTVLTVSGPCTPFDITSQHSSHRGTP